MMLSDVCLSVCLSRTSGISPEQRGRKTKIGTEVAHVTRDSDTTFKVKRSKAGGGILWRLPAYSLLLFASYAAAFSDISLKRSTKVSQCLRRSVLQRCVTFVGQITLTQWRKIINLSYLISLFEKTRMYTARKTQTFLLFYNLHVVEECSVCPPTCCSNLS